VSVTYHDAFEQGSADWLAARCGLLTASEMKLVLTPTLKVASNDKERAHVWEIAGQRITGRVEEGYTSRDMERGREDETKARVLYGAKYASVAECGFITRDFGDFTLGYSPDGLVGDDGLIECKSRLAKFQVQTVVEGVPDEHWLQIQTGLLVTGRKWLDYVSYTGGMMMVIIRAEPDEAAQDAILTAAQVFNKRVDERVAAFRAGLRSDALRWCTMEQENA